MIINLEKGKHKMKKIVLVLSLVISLQAGLFDFFKSDETKKKEIIQEMKLFDKDVEKLIHILNMQRKQINMYSRVVVAPIALYNARLFRNKVMDNLSNFYQEYHSSKLAVMYCSSINKCEKKLNIHKNITKKFEKFLKYVITNENKTLTILAKKYINKK